MIVIATNNGADVLPNLVESLQRFDCGQVAEVIDTGSTDPRALEYLDACPLNVYRIEGGYDTRAWWWAFDNLRSDRYLFLHDSMEVTRTGWFDEWERAADNGSVVALAGFQMFFDDPRQADWLAEHMPVEQCVPTPVGIFGSIFYARREQLELLRDRGFGDAVPTCKAEAQAMERGWAMAFAACGVPVRCLVPHYFSLGESDVGIRKTLLNRA